jgi:hypothetical protein
VITYSNSHIVRQSGVTGMNAYRDMHYVFYLVVFLLLLINNLSVTVIVKTAVTRGEITEFEELN